jgi:hypothetical protein
MAEIVERTGGIRLFVEEMTKAMLGAAGEGATLIAVSSSSVKAAASLNGKGVLAFAG